MKTLKVKLTLVADRTVVKRRKARHMAIANRTRVLDSMIKLSFVEINERINVV